MCRGAGLGPPQPARAARGWNLAAKSARPGEGTGAVVAGLGAGAVPVAAGEGCEGEGLLEGFGGTEPDGGLGSLARREEGDGRDAHDPVLHRRLRIGVDVELADLDAAGVLLGKLLDLGGDHAT